MISRLVVSRDKTKYRKVQGVGQEGVREAQPGRGESTGAQPQARHFGVRLRGSHVEAGEAAMTSRQALVEVAARGTWASVLPSR